MTKQIEEEYGVRRDGSFGVIRKRRSIRERLQGVPGSVWNVLIGTLAYWAILTVYVVTDYTFGIPGAGAVALDVLQATVSVPGLILLAVIVGIFARSYRDVFLKRGGLAIFAYVTLVVVYNIWYWLSPFVFYGMTFSFIFLFPMYLSAPYLSGAIYLISLAGLAAWYFTEGEAFKLS